MGIILFSYRQQYFCMDQYFSMNHTFSVLILAGGKSERMIFPKSYLLYKGKTFLENISEGYNKAGIKKSCIVINKEHCEGDWKQYFERAKLFISIIEKTDSAHGRFHSLKLGLHNLSDTDFCFIHNVDNPFIDGETIKCLYENRNSYGYTVAVYNGKRGHPLLISKHVIKRINELENYDYNLKDILSEFPMRVAEVNSKEILLNINTPQDYENFIVSKREAVDCK
jgi:CTP:molybdopterin cytidylyltransferase MocA